MRGAVLAERNLLGGEFEGLLEKLLLRLWMVKGLRIFIIMNMIMGTRFGRFRCEKAKNVCAEQKDW